MRNPKAKKQRCPQHKGQADQNRRLADQRHTGSCCRDPPTLHQPSADQHPDHHQTGVGILTYDSGPEGYAGNLNHRCVTIPQALTHALLGGQTATPIPGSGRDELTPRELDVLKCIAQGMPNKQIAQTLSISTATVRSHVTRLIQKLDVENRTQLAIYARENGLC